jgi:hypothetical protein
MLHVAPHVELTHVAIPLAGTLQVLPQPPQFARSVAVATQAAPHDPKLASQEMPQWPPVHVAVPFFGIGHTVLHVPQWSGAVIGSTQAPPQLILPPEHRLVHMALSQTCPAAHEVLHPPHRAGSLLTSTHAPEHSA